MDFEGRLEAATVAFKKELVKLEKEKKSHIAELLETQKNIDDLEMKLQDAQQRNKDLEDELYLEKVSWESSKTNLTGELNKAREELQKAKIELNMTKERVKKCERMADRAINEIKAGVEAQIDKAHKEAVFDTCLGFLYTLWLKHLEMDFSFFGEEAIKEVKKFTAEPTKDAKASTSQDQGGAVLPVDNAEVQLSEAVAPPS